MKRYSGIKGKLDTLVGNHYRSRPCDYHTHGGCSGRIEWAHIKSRRYLSTRWLLINAFSLCSSAHFWFTNHPDLFTKWIDKRYPGRLDELNKAFNLNTRYRDHDFAELYEKLKGELL